MAVSMRITKREEPYFTMRSVTKMNGFALLNLINDLDRLESTLFNHERLYRQVVHELTNYYIAMGNLDILH